MDTKEKWGHIVELQQEVKYMLLLSEEHNDSDYGTYIQPVKEQRDALEHIIRAKSAEIGVTSENNDYIAQNYDKAIAHLYRAFFDAADFMGIILREKIINSMKDYDHQCISNVLPEYYMQIRPKLEQINTELSELRGKKDIKKLAAKDLIKEYKTKISQLIDHSKLVIERIPSLEEYKEKSRKAEKTKIIIQIVIAAAIAVFSFLLGYFIES